MIIVEGVDSVECGIHDDIDRMVHVKGYGNYCNINIRLDIKLIRWYNGMII